MKKFIILLLALLLVFCSCGKKEENNGFSLLIIPEGTTVFEFERGSGDILPISDDDADMNALLSAIDEIEAGDITPVDLIDYKEDTPCVTLMYEDEGNYIFKIWSFGGGECAAMLYMTGTSQNIYDVTFKNAEIASLVEKISD